MAGQIPLSTYVTLRDNLLTAYTAISASPTASYSMGERSFSYADRERLWAEILKLNRLILMAEPTIKAIGQSRVSFETLR